MALAQAGARVVVNDFDADAAERTAEDVRALGVDAVAAQGDVSDWSTAEKLVGTAIASLGGLDVLVNNAGMTRDRLIFNISEDEWDSVLAVHLKGHAGLSRFARPTGESSPRPPAPPSARRHLDHAGAGGRPDDG